MPVFTLTGPVPGSAAAATGLQPSTLEAGVNTQVGTNIQASAATATTPQTPVFAVQPRGDGGDRTLTIAAVPIGALSGTSALTVNLLASYDGGTTWEIYALGLVLLVAAGSLTAAVVKNVASGPLYAMATSGLVLGTATGYNVDAALS
jgi:hypothetical protein